MTVRMNSTQGQVQSVDRLRARHSRVSEREKRWAFFIFPPIRTTSTETLPAYSCLFFSSFGYTERLLLQSPYFEHPVGSEAHADGKHGETLALLGQQGKGFSFFLFLKIIFLFFVRQCASGASGTVTFECTVSRSTFQLTLL